MGKAKIWPPPPLNHLTDRHQNLPTWLCRGCLNQPAKFHPDRIWGFVSAHAQFRASNCLLGYLFVFLNEWIYLGSSNRLQPRRPHGFWRKYVKRRGSAQGRAFWGSQNQTLSFTPLFCPQNRHFGALFRRDLEIFARKRLTLDMYYINDP